MLLLEKSVHEKQDSIVGLRRQLEEMKTASIKSASQLKVSVYAILSNLSDSQPPEEVGHDHVRWQLLRTNCIS